MLYKTPKPYPIKLKDTFDILTSQGVTLSSTNTVATRQNSNLALNGLAYLTRELNPNDSNTFTFRILKSSHMSIDIGIRKVVSIIREALSTTKDYEVQYEWKYQLATGQVCLGFDEFQQYTYQKVSQGDTLKMTVYNGEVSFTLNSLQLPIAFTDDRLKGSGHFIPCVQLETEGDSVEVLS